MITVFAPPQRWRQHSALTAYGHLDVLFVHIAFCGVYQASRCTPLIVAMARLAYMTAR